MTARKEASVPARGIVSRVSGISQNSEVWLTTPAWAWLEAVSRGDLDGGVDLHHDVQQSEEVHVEDDELQTGWLHSFDQHNLPGLSAVDIHTHHLVQRLGGQEGGGALQHQVPQEVTSQRASQVGEDCRHVSQPIRIAMVQTLHILFKPKYMSTHTSQDHY